MVEAEDSSPAQSSNESANKEFNTTKLKKTLTNDEIIAQSILFLFAGSDTTSITLSWTSYNLAMHPDVQDKLIEEVDRVLEKHVALVFALFFCLSSF
jgi:cytochrome P450